MIEDYKKEFIISRVLNEELLKQQIILSIDSIVLELQSNYCFIIEEYYKLEKLNKR